jgi:hypothetical protein
MSISKLHVSMPTLMFMFPGCMNMLH